MWDNGQSSFFSYEEQMYKLTFIEKTIKGLPTLLECQLCHKCSHIYIYGYVSKFFILLHWSICISLSKWHTVLTIAYLYLEIKNFNFVFSHDCLSYSWPCAFYINFRIGFSIFTKNILNPLLGFSGDGSKQMNMDRIHIFIMLNFLNWYTIVCLNDIYKNFFF